METMTFADRYQSVLVPVIFEPWAIELIRRAAPRAGEHILDLACGTGVVTRQVAKLVQGTGRLVGADQPDRASPKPLSSLVPRGQIFYIVLLCAFGALSFYFGKWKPGFPQFSGIRPLFVFGINMLGSNMIHFF